MSCGPVTLLSSRPSVSREAQSMVAEAESALQQLCWALEKRVVTAEVPAAVRCLGQERFSKDLALTPSKALKVYQWMFVLMELVENLKAQRSVNQREIFYKSLTVPLPPVIPGKKLFSCQLSVNSCIEKVCERLLQREKHEVGVVTTSKGLVAASESVFIARRKEVASSSDPNEGDVFHIGAFPSGLGISESLMGSSVEIFAEQGAVEAVVVVEKDTVFQALLSRPQICKDLKIIIVTAKGNPDKLSLRFLHKLRRALTTPASPAEPSRPSTPPFVYIGDLDPSGVQIFMTYKKQLPYLNWLGVHKEDVQAAQISEKTGIPLSPYDLRLLNSQLSNPTILAWTELHMQLRFLIEIGRKFEVECLHAVTPTFLSDVWLPLKMENRHLWLATGENAG